MTTQRARGYIGNGRVVHILRDWGLQRSGAGNFVFTLCGRSGRLYEAPEGASLTPEERAYITCKVCLKREGKVKR